METRNARASLSSHAVLSKTWGLWTHNSWIDLKLDLKNVDLGQASRHLLCSYPTSRRLFSAMAQIMWYTSWSLDFWWMHELYDIEVMTAYFIKGNEDTKCIICNIITVFTLAIRTCRPEQTIKTKIRRRRTRHLTRVYNVFQSSSKSD